MQNNESLEAFNAPLHVAHVTLAVRDLDRVATYYVKNLGLLEINRASDRIDLGVDGVSLLTLQHAREAELRRRRDTGLFHVAYLVPSRAALGSWLREASARDLAFDGASDHKVSEALYLTDPEGNGIEIYADRPRDQWQAHATGVVMTTDPMDVESVLDAGRSISPSKQIPSGTRIGHIHLNVADLAAARHLFAGAFGLDVMHDRPGALFFAAGGYHHHIATNTWNSQGQPPKHPATTGLVDYTLQSRDAGDFAARHRSLAAAGVNPVATARGLTFKDTNGIDVTVARP